ncbi:hypothetical protein AA0113_g11738 [Alternaria arborescens]|uniref:Uncharacterized protein n=1 Tax=Alternaria arborescens TaxID=156630 RepID=A0A4Q4Q343_9PLEO|nr:hypothetical protein AA0111_g614 [Alternaria arborescens]RYO32807.1 hypothetical protein AA0113_g11738 [Alternaria arborescens]RYO43295.1 hypothetical protein AA0111_g614 [Alternaria arborescens]
MMTSYDPRRPERPLERQKPTFMEGHDVEMTDAPPRSSPAHQRQRPRKLEYRSVPNTNVARVQSVPVHSETRTSHGSYEHTRRRSQSSSSRQGSTGRFWERTTIRRSTRDHDDDDVNTPYAYERKSWSGGRGEMDNLAHWNDTPIINLKEEIERRKKAEEDLIRSDSRLANLEDQKQGLAQTNIKLQGELIRLKNTFKHLEFEDVQRKNDKMQLESERLEWDSKRKEYDAELKDIKSRWKQAAKELNGLRAQGRGFYQVTDNYLCGLIMQLRYKVRDFGIQYFSEQLPKRPRCEEDQLWKNDMMSTMKVDSYLDYINCSETRPSIIQTFIWRVIVHKVFSRFRWAGSASAPLLAIHRDLEPCLDGVHTSPSEIDRIKKVNIWRATTTGLLLDSMDEEKRTRADCEVQEWKNELRDEISTCLGPFQSKGLEDSQQEFLDIIDEAIKIDKEICRQVSRITWDFGDDAGILVFNPTSMELRKGVMFKANPEITLVTSPGVSKQGRSTGEGFELRVCLLKMEVSCETPQF